MAKRNWQRDGSLDPALVAGDDGSLEAERRARDLDVAPLAIEDRERADLQPRAGEAFSFERDANRLGRESRALRSPTETSIARVIAPVAGATALPTTAVMASRRPVARA